MTDHSRRSVLTGGVALAGVLAVPAVVRSLGAGRGAEPAGRFFDSIGICTHPNWNTPQWGTSNWVDTLLQSGVRHTRGMIGAGGTGERAYGELSKLFAVGGKICAHAAHKDLDRAKTKTYIDFLANRIGAQNLSGIESANEFNNRAKPAGWARQLREFHYWFYDAIRANPKLDGVPVVGPSIWMRKVEDYRALGRLEPKVDIACLHYYTGGRRPTRYAPANRSEASLADAIRDARIIAPNSPLYVTEYGYQVPADGAPLTPGFITENARAKYLIRGLFDLYREGAVRTFIYALSDDAGTGHYWGLTDARREPRPAFHALKNLMVLFDDTGPVKPQDLHYSLTNLPQTVKPQLFQRSDGAFLLVLYQDVDSYSRTAKRDIKVPPVTIGLTLAREASIEVFAPTFSAAAGQRARSVKSLRVPVGDHVTVVRITPGEHLSLSRV